MATIVDGGALWKTIVASLVAGVAVTFAFSLAIFGAARFAELRRDGRAVAAVAFGALAIVGCWRVVAARRSA